MDHSGRAVKLGDYFDGRRPVLLIFGYHTCPMLCSLVQNAAAESLRDLGWKVGREFDVVVISIDPRDSPRLAAQKRSLVMAHYLNGRSGYAMAPGVRDDGWHYLTGQEGAVRRVAEVAGFHYAFDPNSGGYAHPAAIFLVTPDGKLARYLYGVTYQPGDLRYGLLEAAAGHSISTLDRVRLYCMRCDSRVGRYVVVATRVIQVGGVLTAFALTSLLSILWMRERSRREVSR